MTARKRLTVLFLLVAVGAGMLFTVFTNRQSPVLSMAKGLPELDFDTKAPTVTSNISTPEPARLPIPLPVARVAIELQAPNSVVGGTEFSLAVEIADLVDCEGWVDLGFDPGVMTLADASVRHESIGAGAVRIYVQKRAAQTYSASLQFVSSFGIQAAPVRITGAELVSPDGRAVGLILPQASQIVIWLTTG